MKELQPSEFDLVGSWTVDGAKVIADVVCDRIEWLISNKLKRVAPDSGGWEILYCDPADGRFWEKTYPQGEMHGGGPPRLTHLPQEKVKAKYGSKVFDAGLIANPNS